MLKFRIALLGFVGLVLSGCIQSESLQPPNGGDKLWLTSTKYACASLNAPMAFSTVTEIDKGMFKYTYRLSSGTVEHTFTKIRDARYLVTWKTGEKQWAFAFAHVTGSSLVAVQPSGARINKIAAKHGVGVSDVDGKLPVVRVGSPEQQQAMFNDLAYDWEDVKVIFACAASY